MTMRGGTRGIPWRLILVGNASCSASESGDRELRDKLENDPMNLVGLFKIGETCREIAYAP